MPGHHHRAGGLRQTNKKNKRSKASKRSLTRDAGGKVMGSSRSTAAGMLAQSKADRRNKQQQGRDAKRQALMRKKRGLDGLPAPPRVVGIVSLGQNRAIEERLRDFILSGADRVVRPHPDNEAATVTCKFDAHKKDGQLTLLTCGSAFSASDSSIDRDSDSDDAVFAALDLARVCDILLIVLDGNGPEPVNQITEIHLGGDDRSTTTGKSCAMNPFDHLICGDRILAAIKAQGLPTPLTVLAKTDKDPLEDEDHMTVQSTKSLRRSTFKRRLELKKYISRFATTEFGTGNDRVVEVDLTCMDGGGDDTDEDAPDLVKSSSANLVRTLCNINGSPPKWVSDSPRSYILSDSWEYNGTARELVLTGFVRGVAPFDCNSLLHVPNVGTLACKSVCRAAQPLYRHRKKGDDSSMRTDDPADADVLNSDPDIRATDMFATPDALEGEQNLIGFDEEELDSGDTGEEEPGSSRPAGWSDYQSAWLDAVEDDIPDDAIDHGELAEELNRKANRSDAASVGGNVAMDLDEANDVKAEDKRALLEQRRKAQSEDLQFPDEVELEENGKASDRFARYRSLKSFRNSFWDPKENLPETYASIYHFRSFKSTQRAVYNDMKDAKKAAEQVHGQFWGSSPNVEEGDASMEDSDDDDEDVLAGCIPSGSYIKITLRDVAPDAMKSHSSATTKTTGILTAVSLLPHENKVSVLHMGLCHSASCDGTNEVPVKSKDVLTFRCGWRTWKARPVFSQQNLNCDKHKFERFMPVGGAFFAASIFGPVTYTPCPVLVFRETADSEDSIAMVAAGSMIGADADRIAVKRIVLTGYPVRVHKRHATVKYMFYNPQDVTWFKPADLHTKHGLQGNIMESVGEHGTMKCLFNAPIKQHDTVCLPLYKRIYPKYASSSEEGRLVVR